jgi:hypothetical protein
MFWSSMFLTERPMAWGWNVSMVRLTASSGSFSAMRSSHSTSCPLSRVDWATQASPRGKVGRLILSVFADMSRILMLISYESRVTSDKFS